MIQETDLRIGNMVFDLLRHTCEIDAIYKGAVDVYDKNEDKFLNIICDKIYPIPLSEELLTKCGLPNDYAVVYETSDGWFLHVDDMSHMTAIAIPIKSLHELQNAYFIATKKELEVRL